MQTGNTGFIYKNKLVKLVFNTIQLTANQKIYQKKHNQIKF